MQQSNAWSQLITDYIITVHSCMVSKKKKNGKYYIINIINTQDLGLESFLGFDVLPTVDFVI